MARRRGGGEWIVGIFRPQWLEAVTIHCGSRRGDGPHHAQNADKVGRLLPQNGYEDVFYGDGDAGLMGVVARAVLDANGRLTGISLPFFQKAQASQLPGARASVVVETMHERMRLMRQRAQANIVLAGSYDTMEEAFNWKNSTRGVVKPQLILNAHGYWDGLLEFLHRVMDQGFESHALCKRFRVVGSPHEVIEALHEFNRYPMLTDGEPENFKRRPFGDYVTETKHAVIVRPTDLKTMEAIITRIVTYDVSNIPGQTVLRDPIIKPVIFVNEDGFFNGLIRQLETIFANGFSPPERRRFFHFVDNEAQARDLAAALDAAPPLLPGVLTGKHAEWRGDRAAPVAVASATAAQPHIFSS